MSHRALQRAMLIAIHGSSHGKVPVGQDPVEVSVGQDPVETRDTLTEMLRVINGLSND